MWFRVTNYLKGLLKMCAVLREKKGKSIVALPDCYTVIDTETTGLDYEFCEIIEIAAVRVRNGVVVDRFSSLVKPEGHYFYDANGNLCVGYVDAFITSLTGITDEMLQTAPNPPDIIPAFVSFLSNDILIGHNVNFDVNFLYDLCEKLGIEFSNDFIDTMRIARKLLPELPHHRLKDLTEYFGVTNQNEHRSLGDCMATNAIYDLMKRRILSNIGEDAFVGLFKRHWGTKSSDVVATITDFDDTNPFYQKNVVFTGALSSMQRKDAMQIIANLGGINADGVTKKTNFLVIGNEEFVSSVKNGKTNKMKKAEAYILKGADLQVISEDVFLSMIE